MKVHTYVKVHTVLNLDKDEEFLAYSNSTGNEYPFFVNQITFTGGEWVELAGPAMTKKGRGYVNRSCSRKVSDLVKNHSSKMETILTSYKDAVSIKALEAGDL